MAFAGTSEKDLRFLATSLTSDRPGATEALISFQQRICQRLFVTRKKKKKKRKRKRKTDLQRESLVTCSTASTPQSGRQVRPELGSLS